MAVWTNVSFRHHHQRAWKILIPLSSLGWGVAWVLTFSNIPDYSIGQASLEATMSGTKVPHVSLVSPTLNPLLLWTSSLTVSTSSDNYLPSYFPLARLAGKRVSRRGISRGNYSWASIALPSHHQNATCAQTSLKQQLGWFHYNRNQDTRTLSKFVSHVY